MINIYYKKRQWKWLLFIGAIVIFAGTLWYTNNLVTKIANDQRLNLRIWADAVNRKATLVQTTDEFFSQIKAEERRRVELLAEAYKRFMASDPETDLTFFLEMVEKNKTIPVILVDENKRIQNSTNVDASIIRKGYLRGKDLADFMVYKPILVPIVKGKYNFLYYKDSKVLTELQEVLNDLNKSFISEVVSNSASVPVVITDSTFKKIITYGNVDTVKIKDTTYFRHLTDDMISENEPISINLSEHGKCYVLYRNSYLMKQLRYYPLIQLAIIGIFLIVSYLLFSYARKSEQDQVWVGMSKETAHQLGTPMSSMNGWMELMRMDGIDHVGLDEIEKDIKRLEIITERFSKIGSTPQLEATNIVRVVYDAIDYLKPRTSRKVNYEISFARNLDVILPINVYLFEWVIENLVKNAVDAMSGTGTIKIDMIDDQNQVILDFTDTGKGIPRSNFKSVFKPGFTSKKRGWGLGLTLARRIIKSYHNGSVFVKSSQLNVGTTFRIVLKK
jgi:hypothetical protein